MKLKLLYMLREGEEMQREIMFRGLRTVLGQSDWIYGYGAIDNDILTLDFAKGIVRVECDKGTVGQYTGLKDKNGKMIFEGDILSTDNGTFSNTGRGITREHKGMYVSFYGQDLLGRDCFDELHAACDKREIIGNIFSNPELLQEVTHEK
jgi:uncharacterized phage protein (TIGR01671 family)